MQNNQDWNNGANDPVSINLQIIKSKENQSLNIHLSDRYCVTFWSIFKFRLPLEQHNIAQRGASGKTIKKKKEVQTKLQM